MSTLGERIRKARENKEMYQSQLAKLCGVSSPGVISNWEKDLFRPDIDKLMLLCNALDVSVNYLLDYYDHTESFSQEELDLIRKYRQIDERGASEVSKFLDMQIQQIKQFDQENENTSDPDIRIVWPIFLKDTDQLYSQIKKQCAQLRRKKKKSRKSYLDITKHLWEIGYGDAICLGYVIQIFSGDRVPSKQLYQDIADFLDGKSE